MNDYLIAEFVDSVDSFISQPIQQTQRIKYTAYDVSEKYIIFGASSGGLYIFNRHPCYFIKLIPSTEGAVVHLNISNDEKYIGVATIKGTLCVFHNNNETTSKNVQIYTEHQGNVITAMRWHHNNNELFSGDNTGKITVVMVSNLITKTMFQTPCCTLMQLDSRIVQLDWASYFLLVSTLSRVYLCDTQSEHYRQIGKKLRDGDFGACFFGTKISYTLPSEHKLELSRFSILNDKESFTTYDGLENLKIFCARPGARIWEVQLNGTVIRTHQFKQALLKSSSNIIKLENDCDCRLNFIANTDTTHNFNFMKMYVLQNFILTFQKNCLYILDPQNVAVIFWTDVFVDIIDVKVVNKFIYVWTKNHLHVLLFSSLEDFIIKCLLNKKYLLCADLCVSYQSYIKKILPLSKKLYLLSSLEEKLLEINEHQELLEQIKPILNMIKEFSNNRQTAQKLSSGIFVVDNAHFINTLSGNTQFDTPNISRNSSQIFPVQSQNDETDKSDICCAPNPTSNPTSNPTLNPTLNPTFNPENTKFNLLLEEYELNKINSNYKTSLLDRTFHSCSKPDELVDIIKGFTIFTQNLNIPETEINNWCLNICLKYIENNISKFSLEDIQSNEYIQQSFETINTSCNTSCICGFPLPNAFLKPPEFPKIGQILVEFFWAKYSDLKLCHKVPYLWKEIINIRRNDDIETLLPLLIQYGDIEIFREFINRFTYDLCNELVQKMIVLKKKLCLNCEQSYVCDYTGFSWNDLATEMIKVIGAESSVCLLLQNADYIPKSELNLEFYQSCIFTTFLDNFDTKLRNKAVVLVKRIHETDDESNRFGKLLEKSIWNKDSTNINFPLSISKQICFSCGMPLQSPVLSKEKFVELPCGHVLHNICYEQIEHKC